MEATRIKMEPISSSAPSSSTTTMDVTRIKTEPISFSASSASPQLASPIAPPRPVSASPSSSSAANSFMIMGYDVAFPHGKKPFPAQLAVMSKVLLALKSSQHALLESPTGSGKTLALLCSSLTFQKQFVQEMVAAEKLRNEQTAAAAAVKQAHADNQSAAVIAAAAEGTPRRTIKDREEQDYDDDFAATQPTFEQFRFTNGATLKPDGWISMDDKKRAAVSLLPTEMPAPPAKRRHLPASFQETLTTKAKITVQDPDFQGSMDDFHATRAVPSTNKRIKPPTIFFCSRTHSQLAQVVEELKNCPVSYLASPDATNPFASNLKTCVLGSKSHYCVNSKVNRDPSVLDDKCREAVEANQCSYFRKRRKTNDLRRVAPPVWDLEDLVTLAKKHRECAFFHARDALMDADIVFCPYNYLLDPTIRDAVQISLKNAIIVLDEAHNVEDTCRSSASVELTTHALAGAIGSFTDVIKNGHRPPEYQTLLKILNGVNRWLKTIMASSTVLKPTGFEEESNVWSGADCLAMFAEFSGMHQANFAQIQHDLKAVFEYEKELLQQTRAGEEEEKEGSGHRLSAVAVATIRGLLNVAEYMYRDQLKYLDDFKLIVMKSRPRRRGSNARFNNRGFGGSSQSTNDEWDVKLCIWCLNAAVAFSDIIKEARSVILTSGTLSPMDSFAGELGTDFQIRLEANHVVNIRRQVFIGAIMNGPGGVDLSATYKNQQEYRYQDAMGQLLDQYTQHVPGGILMFFPSYSLMEKLENRWRQTGAWAKIQETKTIFIEPRKAGKDFDALLDEYKRTIAESMTALALGAGVKTETSGSVRTGAIFLAVYRGKVSEGIDFSNANARAVLAVGIPYPNVKELQVSLKRKYQDEKSVVDKKLVSGSAWYQLQAFRALNQALGRCIRHRQDYGAIILLDSRYRFQAHTKSLSKWIRPFVREFEYLQDCVPMLSPFFKMNVAELGEGIPVVVESGAPTTNVGSTLKRPLTLKYEPDAEDQSFRGRTLQSTTESVRAYMAKRAAETEPQVFSIFAKREGSSATTSTPTPPSKRGKQTSVMRF